MKLTLVCLLLGCVALSSAQESSSWSGDSVEVQRLLKFSGALVDSQHTDRVGPVRLWFRMYNEPDGQEASWQETQDVRPDARGRYTVLLGETTLGGLPPDIVASRGRHWLGVQATGQAEQPRILLVELPSAWKPAPINSNAPISKRAVLPSAPAERHLALILLIMFLAGMVMACGEVVKWWKARLEQYEPPPLSNLIGYVSGPQRRWRVTQVLWFSLAHISAIRGQSLPSVQSTDGDRSKGEESDDPEAQEFLKLVCPDPTRGHSEQKP